MKQFLEKSWFMPPHSGFSHSFMMVLFLGFFFPLWVKDPPNGLFRDDGNIDIFLRWIRLYVSLSFKKKKLQEFFMYRSIRSDWNSRWKVSVHELPVSKNNTSDAWIVKMATHLVKLIMIVMTVFVLEERVCSLWASRSCSKGDFWLRWF